MQEVAGSAAYGGYAEIAHHHDLPFGVAARGGDHRGAQAFRSVVGSQTAGEQTVAVRVLHDIALMQATGDKGALDDLGPHLQIGFGIGHDDRLPGSSAGGVQPDDVLHGTGEKSKGIGVAQVGSYGERQPGQVGRRPHIGGSQSSLLHTRAEQGHLFPGALDHGAQALALELFQFMPGNVVGHADDVEGRWGCFCHCGCHVPFPTAKAWKLVSCKAGDR